MSEQNQATTQNGNGNGQSRAIVRGPQARLEAIKADLGKASPLLKAMLPKHVTIDRMVRIVTSAVSRTPELLECSPRSIVLATTQACALGLEPNTPLGLGYLVPFKKEAQFIPGYRGLQRLAIQSGEVQWVQSRIVRARDLFEVDYGTEQKLTHRPDLGEDPGPVIGVYAVAEMRNGSKVFEFMSKREVDAIRDRSKAASNGPWITDYEEMARKTAVRRLCKSLPLSEEKLARALEHQARAEAGSGPDFGDVIDVLPEQVDPETGEVTSEQPQSRTDAMKERLAAKAGAAT